MEDKVVDVDFYSVEEEESNEENLNANSVSDILGLNLDEGNQTQAIKHMDIDLDIYDSVYNASPKIRKNVSDGKKILGVYENLDKDLFLSLYKYKPKVLRANRMTASTIVNNKLIRTIAEEEEFKSLKKHCNCDMYLSALGAELLGAKAKEHVIAWAEEEKRKQEEQNKQNGMDPADDNQNGTGSVPGNGSGPVSVPNLINGLTNLEKAQAKAKLDSNKTKLQKQIDKAKAELKAKLSKDKALDQLSTDIAADAGTLKETVSQVQKDIACWGLDDSLVGKRVSYDDKKKAIEEIMSNEKLKRMTEMIGRFKEMALLDQKKKGKDGNMGIKDVTVGNSIVNSLPSEKMMMNNRITKKEFYRKYTQKQLVQYELESTSAKSKGPIVCCIDVSGSMNGEKETWSRAVAIAVLNIAYKQKRDFAYMFFNHSVVKKPVTILKNELNPQKILDICKVTCSGGTSFEAPLTAAQKIINGSKFRKADILFLTDGDCSVSNDFEKQFNKNKEDKDFRLFSIIIDVRQSTETSLEGMSDKIVLLTDFKDEDSTSVAHDIFSTL